MNEMNRKGNDNWIFEFRIVIVIIIADEDEALKLFSILLLWIFI